jgi:hypothetical protein
MRLRLLLIALVVWTASVGASAAAEPPAGLIVPASAPSASTRPIYFGAMGEVARPGVYTATADWTLTELIKRAGGITPEANKTVRVFRGGLLAEQLFLGSGEAPTLLPNDVIVVGGGGSTERTPRVAEASRQPNSQLAVSAIQIAFLNLIERPVVVKMSRDQATLARIVELLGQPADCMAEVRVFAPLGAGPASSDANGEANRPLDSGTVLCFSLSSIHPGRLPALPEPVTEASPSAAEPATLRGVSSGNPASAQILPKEPTNAPQPQPAVRGVAAVATSSAPPVVSNDAHPAHQPEMTAELPIGPETADHFTIDQGARPPDISPHSESEYTHRPIAQSGGTIPTALNQPAFGRPANESHAARMVALMAAMSAVAGLAMLLTFASIARAALAGIPQRAAPTDTARVGRCLSRRFIGRSSRSSNSRRSCARRSTDSHRRGPRDHPAEH